MFELIITKNWDALPMLATVSGGNVANNCANLTELSLPMLEMFTNQNAESAILRYNSNAKSDIHVYAKNLNYANAYVFRGGSQNIKEYIHLGAVRGGYFILNIHPDTRISARVTVDNGFMSYLNISNFTSMETEMLRDIINNLGDNTDGEPISIIFGATNLAKLTDEDIAIATAKNYSLS